LLLRGPDQNHGSDEIRVVDGSHLRDEVPERVSGQDRGSVVFVLNYRRDIAREIMQRQIPHGSGALAIAAGLGTQNAETSRGDPLGHRVEFLGVAPQRRQEDNERAASFRDNVNSDVAAVHHLPRAWLGVGCGERKGRQAHKDGKHRDRPHTPASFPQL
jgi:hypothetical protein